MRPSLPSSISYKTGEPSFQGLQASLLENASFGLLFSPFFEKQADGVTTSFFTFLE